MADQLSPEQLAQLVGLGPCFLHYHTDSSADTLPPQSGHNGEVLSTNGTSVLWGPIPDQLPPQSGHSGDALKTNGTLASWVTLPVPEYSTGTGIQKGDGTGGFVEAVAETDYSAPITVSVTTIATSGTWTKPATGHIAIIECWGGGGSSDFRHLNALYHAGGGGGYNRVMLTLSSLPATVSVTIGAGGVAPAGPSASNLSGVSGGITSFGAYCVANGGEGYQAFSGAPFSSGGQIAGAPNYTYVPLDCGFSGGNGGVGVGTVNLAGNTYYGGGGGLGAYDTGGSGLTTYGGAGGTFGTIATGYVGGNGTVPGGGGGCAGGMDYKGGDGAAGQVKVTII